VPVERCAPGRLISIRSSVPYNSWGSARLRRRTSCVGDRGTMGRPPTCGSSKDPFRSLPGSRRVFLRELGLQAGRRPAYARRAGRDPAHLEALEDTPNDEVPSMAWLHMAHTGPLPPIWDLLDLQPSAETLHLLSLVEFTDLLNECAPDALCAW
jgi:hypothetical protein